MNRSFFRKHIHFFAALLFAAALFVLSPAKKAEAATEAEVTQKVMNYWNTVTSNGTQKAFWNKHYFANTLIEQTNRGDYLSQITRTPCGVTPGAEHLYVNGCSSNNWYGYSQCWGFCLYIGWLSTGAVHEGAEYGTRYYSVPDNFAFRAGDHIRYGWRENGTTATHSLFIYKVENGTVYTIECNWGEYCQLNLRSFPESTMRWYVNRFNGGDNSDFLFRPYSVSNEPPKPAARDYEDVIYNIAGGFRHGEGQSSDGSAFYLTPKYFTCRSDSSFTLTREDAAEIPNGFYFGGRFSSQQISGKWEWYDLPREVKQISGKMEFGFWYYPIDYTITYELDGGTNNRANPDSYNVLYGVRFKPASKPGYICTGWICGGEKVNGINEGLNASFASSADMLAQLRTRTTGNVTVTAVWRPWVLGRDAETPDRNPYVTAEPVSFGL